MIQLDQSWKEGIQEVLPEEDYLLRVLLYSLVEGIKKIAAKVRMLVIQKEQSDSG